MHLPDRRLDSFGRPNDGKIPTRVYDWTSAGPEDAVAQQQRQQRQYA
jgi:hypothetical protein